MAESRTQVQDESMRAGGASTSIRKTWVAFGENGAVASIHAVDSGYEVRPLDGRGGAGTHGTLEVAKRAITTQRSSSVTFEEH
jgi:hypothetical protein